MVVFVTMLPNAVSAVLFGSCTSLQGRAPRADVTMTAFCGPCGTAVPLTTMRYAPGAAFAISTISVLSTVFTPRVATALTLFLSRTYGRYVVPVGPTT